MLGYTFKKDLLLNKLDVVPVGLTIICFLAGLYISQFLPVYIPNKPYNSIGDMYVLVLQTLLGLPLCLCVIRLARTGVFNVFSSYGKNTLWIYVGHTLFIVIQINILRLLGYKLNEIEAIVLSIVYIILLTLFTSRMIIIENTIRAIICRSRKSNSNENKENC